MRAHPVRTFTLIPFLLFGMLALAQAQSYTFETIEVAVPGAHDPFVLGINDLGQLVGGYTSTDGILHGFRVWPRLGITTTFDIRRADVTAPQAINNWGQIVGFYHDQDGTHGFRRLLGVTNTLNVPGATFTEALGNNDIGDIVGQYRGDPGGPSGGPHGFLHHQGHFTTIDIPAATSTTAFDIDNRGVIVGYYIGADGVNHGFVWDTRKRQITTIDAPGAVGTFIVARNDAALMVGLALGSAFEQSFITDGHSFTPFDVPEAVATQVRGINNLGQIVGRYIDQDGVDHSFVATPTKAPALASAID